MALQALIWYATGQMPQIRAVMSGGSVYARPAQQRLEEARRLVDPQLHVPHLTVADHDVHGALALHPGQRVDPEDPFLAATVGHGEPPVVVQAGALVAEDALLRR